MTFLQPYRELFTLPTFGISLVAAIAGKLRPGVASLALLLDVAHYRGFHQAAVVVSVSALAGATLPLRGRVMDRYGYAKLMGPALLAYLATLTVLVLNERAHGPFVVTLAGAFLASVSAPPVQIVTRLMWRELATGALRTTALSLDTMLTDLGYIVGPTVAAFLVAAVAPWAGLAVSALLCAVATGLLIIRRLPHERGRPRSAERHPWSGPLRNRAFRRTMLAALAFFLGVRAIELAYPAWAQQHHSPLMGGVLLSCMAVGSMMGGLTLGALPTRWSVRVTLPVTLAALCVGTVLVAAASLTWTAVVVAVAAVLGIALGPSFVALWATVGDLAPSNMVAETQSWISSVMSLGGAVGAAVVSMVAPALGPGAVLLCAAVALAAGSLLACLASRATPGTAERASTSDSVTTAG
jgi:MFS family permease